MVVVLILLLVIIVGPILLALNFLAIGSALKDVGSQTDQDGRLPYHTPTTPPPRNRLPATDRDAMLEQKLGQESHEGADVIYLSPPPPAGLSGDLAGESGELGEPVMARKVSARRTGPRAASSLRVVSGSRD